MEISSLANNPLTNKATTEVKSTSQNNDKNFSEISNESFHRLLEAAILQANFSTSVNKDKTTSSLFSVANPLNLTQTGLASVLLGKENHRLNTLSELFLKGEKVNINNLSNENSYLEEFVSSVNNTSRPKSLQYQEVPATSLDSHLKGVLQNTGVHFIEAGKQYGINPAFLAAITMHETGNGASNAAHFKNNVAGMMGKNGLKSYESVRDSIFDMTRNLRNNYLNKGRNTIADIGAKYAPIGASNDPTCLNHHWVNGVQSYFNRIIEKTDFV